MNADKMTGRYQRIADQLSKLLQATQVPIARMATIASLLHHKMDHFFWTGFYRYIDGQLIVGPYQGPLACQTLQKDTGACWAALNRKKTIIIPDVRKFPGHIACDSRSKSEIVIPCFDQSGKVFAVMDVDSKDMDSFDQTDAEYLEKIVKLIADI